MRDKPYETLLQGARRRKSKVPGRSLEEEADADRGRVLFCAPFRRLQNKAQVFSLETNAAVRSRLTHSLEVSSIGRYVAQQAISAFTPEELTNLGLAGNERPLITFVETACLLHDLGNPPFGHFGEITISDWFHLKANILMPNGIGGKALQLWNDHCRDLQHFDGNPQGFRIVTRLQASETCDLNGLNLTATTLAATIKYPWSSDNLGRQLNSYNRKKAGYFQTEEDVIVWALESLGLEEERRHPLAFLMEAADDIAYCVSDIEDGIEKGLVSSRHFAEHMNHCLTTVPMSAVTDDAELRDVTDIQQAISLLSDPKIKRTDSLLVERLTPMQDFRSGVIRFLARRAGRMYQSSQAQILEGTSGPLLQDPNAASLLEALKEYASTSLYSSSVVRHRELTAHAALSGLLDAYSSVMTCDRARFILSIKGALKDDLGRPIARESSLVSRIAKKYLAVYRESVRQSDEAFAGDDGLQTAMERIHRIHLVVDHISGMTDEFALQSFQLITGVHINPHRN